MQNYFILHLAPILLLSLAANGMDQQRTIKLSLLASHKLGALELQKDDNGFHVLSEGKKTSIKPYDVDPILRKMNCDQLKAFQKKGYVTGKKLSNGEYTIKAHVRGEGGGPVFAGFIYGLTKVIGYGVPVTLATGVAVATLPVSTGTGLASGASAGTAAVVKGIGGVALKTAVGCTTTASAIGANAAANAVIATVGTTAASNTVAVTAATTASTGGYVAFVEGVAMTAWAWAMALPTP